jgi:hypothetical protein
LHNFLNSINFASCSIKLNQALPYDRDRAIAKALSGVRALQHRSCDESVLDHLRCVLDTVQGRAHHHSHRFGY